ncbi:hypothetical protein VB005_06955 [Metarhizium brunneum]
MATAEAAVVKPVNWQTVLARGVHLLPLKARLFNHKLALRPHKGRVRHLRKHQPDQSQMVPTQTREGETEDLVAHDKLAVAQQDMTLRDRLLTDHLVATSPA